MLHEMEQRQYLARIDRALREASAVALQYEPGTFQIRDNGGRDVVTEVDHRISAVLKESLLQSGEGWLSEEDADDQSRVSKRIVWIVDPLDGTREFVDGLPEWCISVGLVEDGVAVGGGTANPATGEIFLGALDCGVTRNSVSTCASTRQSLEGALVLASRSEYKRGEWNRFEGGSFEIRPMGSVAYKLSLVAAGLADATWTLTPKHEWDVAGGIALVKASGLWAATPKGDELVFNCSTPLLSGLLAGPTAMASAIVEITQSSRGTR
jgi:myo-inositol-1(or 4)-monophosphatase